MIYITNLNETDVQDWRKILNRFLAAEELLKDVECAGNLPGGESERIRKALATVRGNRRKLEDRLELEKDFRSKKLVEDERKKIRSLLKEI